MPVSLTMENVIMSTGCERKFNIDDLVLYGGALKEADFPAARYGFPVPSNRPDDDRECMVNVYESGRITCTGANSVNRAKKCIEHVLVKLGIKESLEIKLEQVVMSGVISPKMRIDGIEDLLQDRFSIHNGNDMIANKMPDTMIMSGKQSHTYIQIYQESMGILIRGANESVVEKDVEDIYEKICQVNGYQISGV